MGSFGQAPLVDIWQMLDSCAQGWTVKEYTHNFCVMWSKRTYPSLPKHPKISVGHIRQMVRHLKIDEACAKKHLPVLG
jgi:hypothetical protein